MVALSLVCLVAPVTAALLLPIFLIWAIGLNASYLFLGDLVVVPPIFLCLLRYHVLRLCLHLLDPRYYCGIVYAKVVWHRGQQTDDCSSCFTSG